MPSPLPTAARTNPNTTAIPERDVLARFIVEEILNSPRPEDDIDFDELKAAARTALRSANYAIYEEIRRG